MHLSCPHCRHEIRIDPARLPPGRASRVACPQCRQTFPVSPPGEAPAPASTAAPAATAAEPAQSSAVPPALEAWLQRELQAMRQGLEARIVRTVLSELRAGGTDLRMGMTTPGGATGPGDPPTALVVADDAQFATTVQQALSGMGYQTQCVGDLRDVVKLLGQRDYTVVAVDQSLAGDDQGGAKVVGWINRLPGPQRRKTFVALFSSDAQTMDTGSAFICGANLTVNRGDLSKFPDALARAVAERDQLYKTFNQIVAAVHG